MTRVRISASKPNYEVGSSSQIKLSFGKKTVKSGGFISTGVFLLKLFLSSSVIFNKNHCASVGSFVFVVCHDFDSYVSVIIWCEVNICTSVAVSRETCFGSQPCENVDAVSQ